jgi:hypothetical protein
MDSWRSIDYEMGCRKELGRLNAGEISKKDKELSDIKTSSLQIL